jgi:hypothetical protein
VTAVARPPSTSRSSGSRCTPSSIPPRSSSGGCANEFGAGPTRTSPGVPRSAGSPPVLNEACGRVRAAVRPSGAPARAGGVGPLPRKNYIYPRQRRTYFLDTTT